MGIIKLTGSASRPLVETPYGRVWGVRPEPAPPPAVPDSERARRAAKQRAYRIRRARGLATATIVYRPDEAIPALIKAGRLTAVAAMDKAAVDAALQLVIADFGKRW